MSEEIECIGICEADEAGTYCTGCGRVWDAAQVQQAESETSPTPAGQEADTPCN